MRYTNRLLLRLPGLFIYANHAYSEVKHIVNFSHVNILCLIYFTKDVEDWFRYAKLNVFDSLVPYV